MASIERTAYPRFRRLVTARELALLSPTEAEVAWAKDRARSDSTCWRSCSRCGAFSASGIFRGPPTSR